MRAASLSFIALSLLLTACDPVELPAERLVVETFAEVGGPLPEVQVRRTASLDDGEAVRPIGDALVTLTVSGQAVPYVPVVEEPGRYVASAERALVPGDRLGLEVQWDGRTLTGRSVLPEPIQIDSVRVVPADAPVLAETLGLDFVGFVYAIEAELFWTAAEVDTAWVRARLRPPPEFLPIAEGVLQTETIEEETQFRRTGEARMWRGAYVVPVESEDAALPSHEIECALVRSGEDYARYALSRTNPDRREPAGNVEGGLGIVVGIALDRRTVTVE